METIKLRTDWSEYPAGSLLEVDPATAKALVGDSTAELYNADAEAKAKVAADEAEAQERQRIEAAVQSALAKLSPQTPQVRPVGVVQSVRPRFEADPKRGFLNFADFVHQVHIAEVSHRPDQRLLSLYTKDAFEGAVEKWPTGLGEAQDSLGGFLVPQEFRAELLQKTWETAQVSSRVRRLPTTSNSLALPAIAETSRADGSRGGGVRGYWMDEAGTKTASSPSFAKVDLKLKKCAALVYATDELLNDSVITLSELITALVSQELAFQLDNRIIRGTGAGVPLGILTAPCTIPVAKESTQQAATLQSENILNMWARLVASSRANAVWFIAQDTTPQLYQMNLAVGTGGVLTFLPPGGLSANPYPTLMGKPVIEIEHCSLLGTVGDIILADMSQYLLIEGTEGMQATTSIHVRFVYDETAFRFVMRVDGQPWWVSAVTPLNGGPTVSPFVVLATRA